MDYEDDFDYTEYDDNNMYNVECKEESFSDKKFDVQGKVCSMEDMMDNMLNNFELPEFDLG